MYFINFRGGRLFSISLKTLFSLNKKLFLNIYKILMVLLTAISKINSFFVFYDMILSPSKRKLIFEFLPGYFSRILYNNFNF